MKTVYIYRLLDPRDRQIKYVGKTVDPRGRYQDHCEARTNMLPVSRWVKCLKAKNLKPILEIIEHCNEESWIASEIWWIAHFKRLGAQLLNITAGGDSSYGGGKGQVIPPERRARISNSLRKHADLFRVTILKTRTPKAIAKMRATKKAQWESLPESEKLKEVAKLREMNHRAHSPEAKRKRSEAITKRWELWRKDRGYTETWDKRRLVKPENRKYKARVA